MPKLSNGLILLILLLALFALATGGGSGSRAPAQVSCPAGSSSNGGSCVYP